MSSPQSGNAAHSRFMTNESGVWMIESTEKYVLHIPLSKCEDNVVMDLNIDGIMEELIGQLDRNGFDSFYIAKVQSHYKSRIFDEVLITIFTDSSRELIGLFRNWFLKNNDVLRQEAFAYERNSRMVIEKL